MLNFNIIDLIFVATCWNLVFLMCFGDAKICFNQHVLEKWEHDTSWDFIWYLTCGWIEECLIILNACCWLFFVITGCISDNILHVSCVVMNHDNCFVGVSVFVLRDKLGGTYHIIAFGCMIKRDKIKKPRYVSISLR